MNGDIALLCFQNFHHCLRLMTDDITVVGLIEEDVNQFVPNSDLLAGDHTSKILKVPIQRLQILISAPGKTVTVDGESPDCK